MSSDDATWVPVEACTLPTAEQPMRVAEFDSVLAGAGVEIGSATRARFSLVGADLDTVRDLTARESECCSFFTFETEVRDDVIDLIVEVPVAQADVLAGLVRLAEARPAAGPPAR